MSNVSSGNLTSRAKTERKSLNQSNALNLRGIKEEDADGDDNEFEIQN